MKKLLGLAATTTLLAGIVVTQIEAYQTTTGAAQLTFKSGLNMVYDNNRIEVYNGKHNITASKEGIQINNYWFEF